MNDDADVKEHANDKDASEEMDSLTDELLVSNPAFRELVERSKASLRRELKPKEGLG